ncbi:hypothetical protein SAY86_013006 [Trapa natans]|uniref:C3H1-type domain-containing protein n=1 Tax=Trapa natans TaxID=22666 RepID=A0AAN7LYV6_TRANT|nr:hypothetical protein SAY86_013006 [Trapa natans]
MKAQKRRQWPVILESRWKRLLREDGAHSSLEVDISYEELQLVEENETLASIRANDSSADNHLILAYRKKKSHSRSVISRNGVAKQLAIRSTRSPSHDWTDCPFAHLGEKARRRDPRRFVYWSTVCSEYRRGSCSRGDNCEFAHGVFECWLHPSRQERRQVPELRWTSADSGCTSCLFYSQPSAVNSSPTSTLKGLSDHLSSPPISPSGSLSPPLSPPLSPMNKRRFSLYTPLSPLKS